MSDIAIRPADPLSPEARRLIADLDDYLGRLYGPEENHLLAPERLAEPDILFLLAWQGQRAVGCGAIRIDKEGDYAEVKRMYVDPAHRGHGIAGQVLMALNAEAARHGLAMLKLETGPAQTEAIALYTRFGFTRCGAFGGYPCGGSLFMERAVTPA